MRFFSSPEIWWIKYACSSFSGVSLIGLAKFSIFAIFSKALLAFTLVKPSSGVSALSDIRDTLPSPPRK